MTSCEAFGDQNSSTIREIQQAAQQTGKTKLFWVNIFFISGCYLEVIVVERGQRWNSYSENKIRVANVQYVDTGLFEPTSSKAMHLPTG